MGLFLNLNQYCTPDVIRDGKVFYKDCKIKNLRQDTADGMESIRAKIADGFNFVHRVSISVSEDGTRILDYQCDCRDAALKRGLCKHCVALIQAVGNESIEGNPSASLPVYEQSSVSEEPVLEDTNAVDAAESGIAMIPVEEASAELDPGPLAESESEEEIDQVLPDEIREMEICFGTDIQTDTPVLWRPNNTTEVFHTNTGIIGTMGTGKTQFTKSMIRQLYDQQGQNYNGTSLGIFIFDYKGDYNETKKDFTDPIHATVLKPYLIPYNPLALHVPKVFKPLLPMHTANLFKDTISKIYNLGAKQQQTLLDCIVKAYQKQRILMNEPLTWKRKAPTFEQVYQIYQQEYSDRTPDSLTAAINKLHQFCIFENDPEKACSLADLLKGVTVMDLSGYDEDIQSLIVAITLDQFYSYMQTVGSSLTDGKYRQLRYILLVDEADNFMSQHFPSLKKIMKEGREFGVGVVLSTQSLTHFSGGEEDYSRYILSWIVHNVNDLKPKDIEYVFKLQPKDPDIASIYGKIKSLEKHESVVKIANEKPLVMKDLAFWQLINSDFMHS